jgi:CoA-transferase family III
VQPYKLAVGADVFVESYRTRKISNLGLSPEELAARRPGIVYASARCCGYDGRWPTGPGSTWKACVSPGSPPKKEPSTGLRSPPTQSGVLFDQRQKSLVQMTSVNVYPF